jgi:hypothetical protein
VISNTPVEAIACAEQRHLSKPSLGPHCRDRSTNSKVYILLPFIACEAAEMSSAVKAHVTALQIGRQAYARSKYSRGASWYFIDETVRGDPWSRGYESNDFWQLNVKCDAKCIWPLRTRGALQLKTATCLSTRLPVRLPS